MLLAPILTKFGGSEGMAIKNKTLHVNPVPITPNLQRRHVDAFDLLFD